MKPGSPRRTFRQEHGERLRSGGAGDDHANPKLVREGALKSSV